jgi:molecular chaperone GrpE
LADYAKAIFRWFVFMQRFNDIYLREPRYRRRPDRREIRIPVRANGHGRQADVFGTQGQAPAKTAEREPVVAANSQDQVEASSAEATEWKEKYMRLAAERDNERKRLERVFANQAEQEKERILRDMLPLADNLERALTHTSEPELDLREGVELTLKAFAATLASHGVEPMKAAGKPFDPNLHEAVATISHPTLPPGTVARVEETGYTLNGQLLRPARVLVVAE